MLSFLAKAIPRTQTAPLNKILFDNGRSSITFKSPGDKYLVINNWPPASCPENRNIALRPPLHWHRHQEETFHVLSGTARFSLDGKDILRSKGETMSIPVKSVHTFCNASESEELVIEFVLEPGSRERDECFFSRLSMLPVESI